jgi:hypothetical protein
MMYSLGPDDLQRMGKSGPDTPPDDGEEIYVDKLTGELRTVPRGIDPGWDYAPGASRVDLIRRQNAYKAKTLPGGIGEALARSQGDVPGTPVSAVSLRGMDVHTVDGVRDLLSMLARSRKDWLPHGVKAVRVTDDAYLAASDQRGYFALSRWVDPAIGRSGYELITGALTALRDGRPLSFHEEYGIETLWHEVQHNAQAHRLPSSPMETVRIAEGLHQLLSRQTYPDLLQWLGAEARHARAIREHGPAYPKTVARLSRLLARLGAMDEEFRVDPVLLGRLSVLNAQTDFAALLGALATLLKSLKGSAQVNVDAAVQAIAEGRDP